MEYRLKINGKAVTVTVDKGEGGIISAVIDGKKISARWHRRSDRSLSIEMDKESHAVYMDKNGGGKTVMVRGVPYFIEEAGDDRETKMSRGRVPGDGKVTPPMPSQVVRIMARPGDRVEKGDGLIVVSAMKLESTLTAPFSGTVAEVPVKVGDRVTPGQVLARVEKDTGAEG